MTGDSSALSPLVVCGIAGSIRAGSYNVALLRAACELVPESMEIRVFQGLASIPPYDADLDGEKSPAPVRELRNAIRQADALLISTPEYNYSIPGLLKNAIDWASRPGNASVLNRKPAAIMGASSGAYGTVRAQLALRQSLLFTETHVLLKPEVLVTFAKDKFDPDGKLIDKTTRDFVRQLLERLAAWTVRLKGI